MVQALVERYVLMRLMRRVEITFTGPHSGRAEVVHRGIRVNAEVISGVRKLNGSVVSLKVRELVTKSYTRGLNSCYHSVCLSLSSF